ncbi:MAG: zinc ribbon domain-containing protein [Melioribacteraceae bacterium]|nr:zinc ribbon domain-containing protein [Melioribacteraceae bacterium]
MPTYDYKCTKCGDTFECFQKMTDAPLKECKNCGGELKRLIGAGIGPIFKGSGFYQTDYKSGVSSAADTSKSASASTGKTNDSKSSDNTSKSK